MTKVIGGGSVTGKACAARRAASLSRAMNTLIPQKNLITDVAGLKIGEAHDEAAATGVSAIVFDRPAVASIATLGGAPGVRDTGLLEPEMIPIPGKGSRPA